LLTVTQVYNKLCQEDGTAGIKGCRELVSQIDHPNNVLIDGVVRELARRLEKEGYPATDTLNVSIGFFRDIALRFLVSSDY
jgi:hypothetical protein